jgi:small multidrug resistance family-3 protein
MSQPLPSPTSTGHPAPVTDAAPPRRSKVTGGLAALACAACCALPVFIAAGVLTGAGAAILEKTLLAIAAGLAAAALGMWWLHRRRSVRGWLRMRGQRMRLLNGARVRHPARCRTRTAWWHTPVTIIRSVLLFALAALAEIGGPWLIWQGVREHKGVWWIGAGIAALGTYGFVATFQPDANFGRILAAYGGVFVAGSLAWGMVVDKFRPDRYDLIGALICLVGVAVIMYAPRS